MGTTPRRYGYFFSPAHCGDLDPEGPSVSRSSNSDLSYSRPDRLHDSSTMETYVYGLQSTVYVCLCNTQSVKETMTAFCLMHRQLFHDSTAMQLALERIQTRFYLCFALTYPTCRSLLPDMPAASYSRRVLLKHCADCKKTTNDPSQRLVVPTEFQSHWTFVWLLELLKAGT